LPSASLYLADGPTQASFESLGSDVQSFLKRIRSFFPALQPFQTHALVVVGRLMLRIRLRRPLITLSGVDESLELELNMTKRRVQFREILAARDGHCQLFNRQFRFAFQMQRNRFPQRLGRGRYLCRAGWRKIEPKTL